MTSPTNTAGASRPTMSDPAPFAFALFAFALGIFALRFIGVTAATVVGGPLSEALTYAVLVAGVAETIAGILSLVKGDTYSGYITGIFGIWLLGFFLLSTKGAGQQDFRPDAVSWFVLLLIVPIAIMAIPAFAHRNVAFMIIFIAVVGLLLFLGLGYHSLDGAVTSAAASKSAPDLSGAAHLLKVSGWFSAVGAVVVWFVFAHAVLTATGVIREKSVS